MRTLNPLPGDDITTTARQLVAAAPARATFNGIPIRARYATTRAADIVTQWQRGLDLRVVLYQNSPKGKTDAARNVAEIAEAQRKADAGMGALAALDMTDAAAVLAWVETMAEPCDRVGVTIDKAGILIRFALYGWGSNVNCGADFNADDARNFAGWIVGQWLHMFWPGVGMLIAQWREKFATAN